MKYKVIYSFADLHDKKYKYEAGDKFPRQGLEVSEDRIKELMGNENKIKRPLIEEIPEEVEKPTEEVEKPSEKSKKKTTKRKK